PWTRATPRSGIGASRDRSWLPGPGTLRAGFAAARGRRPSGLPIQGARKDAPGAPRWNCLRLRCAGRSEVHVARGLGLVEDLHQLEGGGATAGHRPADGVADLEAQQREAHRREHRDLALAGVGLVRVREDQLALLAGL